jgi:hypothetical protein
MTILRLSAVGAARNHQVSSLTQFVSMLTEKKGTAGEFRRSVERLVEYLSDRRPKVKGALETFDITPSQSYKLPRLSEASIEDLRALPNAPLTALTPEQLLLFAQIVDTALFKSYLVIRPGLVGALCRLPNWCEVSEVEQELRAREVSHSQHPKFPRVSKVCRNSLT